jgi:hypothetical protein
MKLKYLVIALITLFALNEADAQRTRTRRTRESRTRDTTSFTDRLTYDIRFGNIGIQNGFNLALKPGIGYKFGKVISAGVGAKLFYQFVNVFGADDYSLLDFGGFGYARGKIGESFYLQAEYSYTQFDYSLFNGVDYNVAYPLFGGGYLSGGEHWKYGLEIMFPLNSQARDLGTPLEYWISVAYKF